ncbi:MAG: hypothetical protein EA378_04135 [Phycisphaerales bacterium]|nr:MAG: hypothetical protein EA378_04135 [Phycisphaerales bacterium]
MIPQTPTHPLRKITMPRRFDRPLPMLRQAAIVMLTLLGAAASAPAQDAPSPAAANANADHGITLSAAREALAALEERADLDDALRQQLTEIYQRTLATIELAIQQEQRALQSEQQRQAVPSEREAIDRDLAQGFEGTITVPDGASLEAIRQLRDQAEAAVNDATDRLAQVTRDQASRAERRASIPNETAAAQGRLEEVEDQLSAAPPADQNPELTNALRAEALATRRLQLAILDANRAELANYDARAELLPLRRQRANRRLNARNDQLQLWEATLTQAEAVEGQREADEARRLAAEATPAVRAIAERNLELIVLRTGEDGLASRLAERRAQYERLEAGLRRVAAQYERDRQRVEAATGTGLTDARLRTQRMELTDPRELRGHLRRLRGELAVTQRELADLEYERSNFAPIGQQIDAVVAEQQWGPDDPATARLRRELGGLLAEQRSQFDALIEAYREYNDQLLRMQDRLEPLILLTTRYIEFIDERILWIRSMDGVGLQEPARITRTVGDLISASGWASFTGELWRDVQRRPYAPSAVLLAVSLGLYWRARFIVRLKAIAEQTSSLATDKIGLSTRALLITLFHASVWPVALWLGAWWLNTMPEPGLIARALGAGALGAAPLLLTTRVVQQLVRDQGLAEAHFRWRPQTRSLLRRHVRWFELTAVPIIFVMGAAEWEALQAGADPLARVAFVLLMVTIAGLSARLLRPGKGIAEAVVSRHRGEWVERAEYIWYPASIIAPLALALIALLGFFYTGLQFESRILATVQLLIGVIVAQGIVQRGLLIARRRLAMEEARRRREAQGEIAEKTGSLSAEGGSIKIEEPKLDLVSIDSQARQLLRTGVTITVVIGLWLVWARMLPALGMLERVEVWPNFGNIRETAVSVPEAAEILGPQLARDVLGAAPAPRPTFNGSATPPPFSTTAEPFAREDMARLAGADPPTPDGAITLINIIGFIIFALVAYVLARNAPGLLEITLLQRLPMTPSGRYAVVTLTRYVIAVVGVVIAFSAIGIGWSQVQWLVAAITLGIGFGLQEIVANFISGIIILIERPIRVGDTVTVDGVSGNVTRIRMRATTVTDWDRKELIIPNKTFITANVINWTLSDPILRVVVPVGVAYGSDTVAAESILLRVANEHACVLKDPAPSVVFSEFGDSALTFNLRVFIPNISEIIRVRHELHRAIDDAFREAKIEIAFPQRDIHIRSISGPLTLQRAERKPDPTADLAQSSPEPGENEHKA